MHVAVESRLRGLHVLRAGRGMPRIYNPHCGPRDATAGTGAGSRRWEWERWRSGRRAAAMPTEGAGQV